MTDTLLESERVVQSVYFLHEGIPEVALVLPGIKETVLVASYMIQFESLTYFITSVPPYDPIVSSLISTLGEAVEGGIVYKRRQLIESEP